MTSVKLFTLLVILVVAFLMSSPATAFDVSRGTIWLEFGGPLGETPLVLLYSGSSNFPDPPVACSPATPGASLPAATYPDCVAALKAGTATDCKNLAGTMVPGRVIVSVPEQSIPEGLEFTIGLVQLDTKPKSVPWVVGSSWDAICIAPSDG